MMDLQATILSLGPVRKGINVKSNVSSRWIVVSGLIAVSALSMGSSCPLLGGSSTSTGTPVSTLPTIAPTATKTATPASTSTPSSQPTATVTPTPTATPLVAFLTAVSPNVQSQNLAINIIGGNLTGATNISFAGNFTGVTSPVNVTTGYVISADGSTISLLVPNLGTAGGVPVTITVTAPLGFATLTDGFIYNP